MKNPKKCREYILPTKIQLGYQDISVEEVLAIDETQGSYNNDSHEIKIRAGMGKRETLNTMLHESLHAVIYIYGLKSKFKDDDSEENMVNALANGLAELFLRNPSLVKFIEKSL